MKFVKQNIVLSIIIHYNIYILRYKLIHNELRKEDVLKTLTSYQVSRIRNNNNMTIVPSSNSFLTKATKIYFRCT